MKEDQITTIIEKYLNSKASSEEIEQLNEWLAAFENRPSLISSLSSHELKIISNKMFSAIVGALDINHKGSDK